MTAAEDDEFEVGVSAGGDPPAPGAPPVEGNSVCMKQHRLPYGQEPETQKVFAECKHQHDIRQRNESITYPANFSLVLE